MRAVVRVPATSANLGPGFDALGLALGLYDEVSAEVTQTGGVRVSVHGEGAGELPTGADHLVVQAMDEAFAAWGRPRPGGLVLTCHNRIPQARGLGSSSAAIVAGLLLGRELAGGLSGDGGGLPGDGGGLPEDEVLALADRLEGHPDNVAACLLGGFTIAWRTAKGVARAVRLDPAPGLAPVVFVPPQPGLTATARAALPASVPHAEAAFTAGRAALLVHALTAGPDRLFEATEDRLHQHYRAAGAPATAQLVGRLRAAGVAAVVSGAGPSVLALSPVPSDFDPGQGWVRHVLAVEQRGAAVRSGNMSAFVGAE